jgi:hypothetical protein
MTGLDKEETKFDLTRQYIKGHCQQPWRVEVPVDRQTAIG